MTEHFHVFAEAVSARLAELSKHELFEVEPTDIFASYLGGFPQGSNPVYRERTEHDCSTCKQFIRNLGRVVAIVDGEKQSVWKCEGLPHPYDAVAEAMDALVAQLPITAVPCSAEVLALVPRAQGGRH